jgi:hypothetical protein
MSLVSKRTRQALREFVYGDLTRAELSRRISNIEHRTEGANPHNVGMAASAYLSSTSVNKTTEREGKKAVISAFPTEDMKQIYSRRLVDEVKR